MGEQKSNSVKGIQNKDTLDYFLFDIFLLRVFMQFKAKSYEEAANFRSSQTHATTFQTIKSAYNLYVLLRWHLYFKRKLIAFGSVIQKRNPTKKTNKKKMTC